MLPSLQETIAIFNQEANRSEINYGNRRRAARQFWRAYSRGTRRRLWGALTGRSDRLQDLGSALGNVEVKTRHYAGVRSVPIELIRGSEGRSHDFDARFDPIDAQNEDRWIGIATARRLGVVLPPVDLIQVGEDYFVRDGHHRISVANSLGQNEVDANVTVWEV
jgi:hypothetical protein